MKCSFNDLHKSKKTIRMYKNNYVDKNLVYHPSIIQT